MDSLAEKLDEKLRKWEPHIARDVRRLILEIIELADQGIVDIMRSRQLEQEVLDLIDEPETR